MLLYGIYGFNFLEGCICLSKNRFSFQCISITSSLFQWRGTLLFDLHTALYWKANKKFAMSQGIKPKFEIKVQNSLSTDKDENKIKVFLIYS